MVSGEESAQQIRIRAERLKAVADNLFVLPDGNLAVVEERVKEINPFLLVVDSIQTIFHPEIPSAPGSISQVKECTARLINLTKKRNMATFISGHVTKEGAIAGPKILEHMVDTVLYFEGERHHSLRIIRAVKNRFGATQESGIFEMKREGLNEIANPSSLFMKERAKNVAGNVVVPTMEGSRPILIELQALVSPSYLTIPRRLTSGVDHNRLSLILAVLEKHLGISLEHSDVFINIAGGIKTTEPGCDLAIALSVISAHRNQPLPSDLVVFGEVGLAGEVRFVSQVERRLREACKLGFGRAIVPLTRGVDIHRPKMEIVEVKNLEEALVYN